jgi:hypothetical protein
MSNADADIFYTVFMICLFLLALVIYLLPWLIGKSRDMHGTGVLLFVNLFFGWSVVGWVVCILWAALGQTKAQKRYYEGVGYRIPASN